MWVERTEVHVCIKCLQILLYAFKCTPTSNNLMREWISAISIFYLFPYSFITIFALLVFV